MAKKNKFWFFGIITISLCISFYLTANNTNPRRVALAGNNQGAGHKKVCIDRMFEETGYQWDQTDINSWTVVELGEVSMKDLEDMANRAGEFFSLKDNLELSTNHYRGVKQVNLRGNDKKGLKYDIIITNSEETHIIVNILDNRFFMDTSILIDKIQHYFHSINATPHIFTTLTGAFEGKLDIKQRRSMINNLIKGIKGTATQSMEDKELISIAGYSPIIDTAPMDNINFQIASRYNRYRHKTYLWVGTPIITIEY